MRVIAGELRGRRLKTVSGLHTRPTADKVKGAIFNVLRDKVQDARILDLFAGTGNLTIEAISRGAKSAILVEMDSRALKVIADNIHNAGISECTVVFPVNAFSYLSAHQNEVYDLIFLDPPYRLGLVDKALLLLAQPCRLSEGGVIVAETGSKEELNLPEVFEIRQTGEYGDTKVWYLQKKDLK